MTRFLALLGMVTFCVVGCSTPDEVRFVPTSSVVRVEPQPVTYGEFHAAEQQDYLVAATGLGVAYGLGDLPTQLQPGERLHVLRVNPVTGEVLVRRLDYNTLARVDYESLEVRATTYHPLQP